MKISTRKAGSVVVLMVIMVMVLISGYVLYNPACHEYRDPGPEEGVDSQTERPENREQRRVITENCLQGDYGIISIE